MMTTLKRSYLLLFLIICSACSGTKLQNNRSPRSVPNFTGEYPVDDGSVGSYLELEQFASGSALDMMLKEKLVDKSFLQNFDLKKKPNILFILSDDQPYHHLGFMGNKVLQTPHIDKLAREGVVLENMYVPNGQCVPSRGALWMSQSPYTIGLHANGRHYNANNSALHIGNQLSLPDILSAVGYETAFFGKCHLGAANKFNYYATNPESSGRFFRNLVLFEHGSLRHPNENPNLHWHNFAYHRLPGGISEMKRDLMKERKKGQHVSEFLTDEVIQFLANWRKLDKSRPFFIWLAHYAPHVPTTPPKNQNIYTIDELPPSLASEDDLSQKPSVQQHSPSHWSTREAIVGDSRLIWEGFTPSNWDSDRRPRGKNYVKQMLKDAYEVTTHMDYQIGRVLEALSQEERNNTIIIFMADNGLHYGEHQLFQKGPFLYDTQTRTPMIFVFPQKLKGKKLDIGKRKKALVSSLDIAPTLLDLIGVRSPESFKGESFFDLITGSEDQYRDYMRFEYFEQGKRLTPIRGGIYRNLKFSHYLPARFCKRGQYICPEQQKISTNGLEFELYDLKTDPFEMKNLLYSADRTKNTLDEMIRAKNKYSDDLKKLLRGSAIWATVSPDMEKLTNRAERVKEAKNISMQHDTESGTALLSWDTERPSYTAAVWAPSTNLAIQQEFEELESKRKHLALVDDILEGEEYQLVAYSIGQRGRGKAFKLIFHLKDGKISFENITDSMKLSEKLIGIDN